MFAKIAKFWITCTAVLLLKTTAASAVDHQADPTGSSKENLNENASVSWTPSFNGMQRFDYLLPLEGIDAAQKYDDTNALFYLAKIRDAGLRLAQKQRRAFHVEYAPNYYSIGMDIPIDPQNNVEMVVQQRDEKPLLKLNYGYRYVSDWMTLSDLKTSLQHNNASLEWSRLKLNSSERFETLSSLKLNSNFDQDSYLAFGMRYFANPLKSNYTAQIIKKPDTAILSAGLEYNINGCWLAFSTHYDTVTTHPEFLLSLNWKVGAKSEVIDTYWATHHSVFRNPLISKRSLQPLSKHAKPMSWKKFSLHN